VTLRQCVSLLSLSSLAGTLSSSSKLHLFCLSFLSSRPCENQRLPPDATNALIYRHFTQKLIEIFPFGGNRKGKQRGAIIVLLTSQSTGVVLRMCLHSMRCVLENRNALLRRGISADRLASRRTENYRGLRKNSTKRKRDLELATARRTRRAVVVQKNLDTH
jgi:hypothetical protein